MEDENLPIHPATTALFVACCVQGYLLETVNEMFSLSKRDGAGVFKQVKGGLSFQEVANFLGAEGKTTLRQATEQAGFEWPVSAAAFVEAVKKL